MPKRCSILLCFLGLALIWAPLSRGQNLLINGDFSTPLIPGNQEVALTGTDLTGWTIGTTGAVSLQSAAYANFYTGGLVNSQQLDLTGITSFGGTIMQSVGSAIVGAEYHFGIDNFRYGSFSGLAFQVIIESINTTTGAVIGTLASQSFSTAQGVQTHVGFDFTNFSSSFSATTLFRVTIQDISGSDTNAGWVDNASIVLVPEAATWGAIGGGLGLLMIGRRWRAQRKMTTPARAEV